MDSSQHTRIAVAFSDLPAEIFIASELENNENFERKIPGGAGTGAATQLSIFRKLAALLCVVLT